MKRRASVIAECVCVMAMVMGVSAQAHAQTCAVPQAPDLPPGVASLDLAAFEALKARVWAFEDARAAALNCLNGVIFRDIPATDAQIAQARAARDALFPRDGSGRVTDPVNETFSRLTDEFLRTQDERANAAAEAASREAEARATSALIEAMKSARKQG